MEAGAGRSQPKTLEECAKEAELVKKAKAGLLVEKPKKELPAKGRRSRTFNVFVDGDYFAVEVEAVGGAPVDYFAQPGGGSRAPELTGRGRRLRLANRGSCPGCGRRKTRSPHARMVIRYEVKEGDAVKEGDVIMILEAIKMENSILAPASGAVKQVCARKARASKGDVLAVIGLRKASRKS